MDPLTFSRAFPFPLSLFVLTSLSRVSQLTLVFAAPPFELPLQVDS